MPSCFNCREKTEEGLKVKHKDKIKWMCDSCFFGYQLERENKNETGK
jgi:hypothetical protein